MQKEWKLVLRFVCLFCAVVFFAVGILGLLLPILPGYLFLVIGLFLLLVALPRRAKNPKPPFVSMVQNKTKTLGKEETQIKLLSLLIVILLIILLIYFLIVRNFEFVYYIALFLPLAVFIYYIHRKIYLHLPILLLLVLLVALSILGTTFVNGIRLYETYFSFLRYDKLVHFLAGLILSIFCYNIIFNYIKERKRYALIRIFLVLVFLGGGLGALWEIVEGLFVSLFPIYQKTIGDYANTIGDLLFNFLGAIVGSFLVVRYHKAKIFKEILSGKIEEHIIKALK